MHADIGITRLSVSSSVPSLGRKSTLLDDPTCFAVFLKIFFEFVPIARQKPIYPILQAYQGCPGPGGAGASGKGRVVSPAFVVGPLNHGRGRGPAIQCT